MRKTILSLSFACLSATLLFFSVVKAGGTKATAGLKGLASSSDDSTSTINASASRKEENLSAEALSAMVYDSLKLDKLGLSKEAMSYAYKGYQHLVNSGTLIKDNILTICDFSQSSHKKRMFVIDVKNYKVLMNTYVAHGRNSGVDYATNFSNQPESLESSLGFYVTEDIYTGKHGLSLKINGLEKGWNDKAEERAVVVHGADYIGDHRLSSPYMGRSFGCPAVPQNEVAKLISLIKNGSCLFIYHPTKTYLNESKIING